MKNNTVLSHAKYIFLVLLTLSVGMMACSKDKEKEPASKGLEGTWQLSSFSYDGNWVAVDEPIAVTMTAKDINNVRVTFNNDGTVIGNGTSFTLVVAEKANPNAKIEIPSKMFEEKGIWEKDGNMLYVTEFMTSERMGIPITELNGTTLRLSGTMVDEDTDGIATLDIRFTRSN